MAYAQWNKHDGIFTYLFFIPESVCCCSCFLMFVRAFVVFLSTGITKFEFEKENEVNSGSYSQMTP